MNIAGIICEYDPFHKGHLRQIHLLRQQLGADTAVVCVMSGNYVQRGMPAAWDKFARAEAAVACGADVVLELPLTAVLRSAEGFARAGVEILTAFGCTHLCFGAECGSAGLLMELAKTIDTPEARAALREGLDKGLSYAAARQAAVGDTSVLSAPNNILGLEYCRAILHTGSSVVPLAIQRNGDYHADLPQADEPSATAIRKLLPDPKWANYVPAECSQVLKDAPIYDLTFGERVMLARLRTLSEEDWEQTAHGSEGLWRKAMKACRRCTGYDAIVEEVKSRRYPATRIQRLLLCAFLGITAEQLTAPLPYVRLLGFGARGRPLLRRAKDTGELVIVNPGQLPPDKAYYRLEITAADLFGLFIQPDLPCPCATEQNGRINFENL